MADLWIRTQGVDCNIGSSLVKVSTLEIEPSGKFYAIWDSSLKYPLGCYKSKDRAMEVLDEIQKLLTQPTAFLKADIPQGLSYEDANKYSEQIFDFCKQYDFIYVGSKDVEVIPTNNTNIVYTMPKS